MGTWREPESEQVVAIRKSSSSDSWLQQVGEGRMPGVGEGQVSGRTG